MSTILAIWEEPQSLQEIKSLFAPNLTDNEFKAFVGMGKATGLNPFLKELWAVKYDKSAPASYFIGRDGYRKAAQNHADYDYHKVEAVYSEDEFSSENGVVNHKYKFANRGILLGAYCIVKRKSSSLPIYTSVLLSEYDKNHSNWRTMKETMIKKTAESQGLKSAFQDVFSGTRDESEEDYIKSPTESTEKLNKIIEEKVESVNTQTGEIYEASILVSEDTAIKLDIKMDELEITPQQKSKILSYYKVKKLAELTQKDYEHLVNNLNTKYNVNVEA